MPVDETADMKRAIPALVFGAVGTAGQRCTSTRRVFIHESIFDDVLAKLVTVYGQVEKKIGDPTDPANLMRPLNSSNAGDAYLDAHPKAKAAVRTVASDGQALTARKANFLIPTLNTCPDHKAEVVQTQTFAQLSQHNNYSTTPHAS